MTEFQIKILIGQTVRSGTNYVGSMMFNHPQVVTIPPEYSHGEFNLFRDDLVQKLFFSITKRSFALGLEGHYFDEFLKHYGSSWLRVFMKAFDLSASNEEQPLRIFLKSPVIDNFHLWKKAFPDAKIAILARDGRDNTMSVVRASNDKRSWHTLSIKLKKRLNYYLGRSFVNGAKNWAETARIFHSIEECENVRKFKYEELLLPEGIKELLEFYELDAGDDVIVKLADAPVVGSSWGVLKDGTEKPNWIPITKKDKLKFTRKWESWSTVRKEVFKKIAGKELIALGYEKDYSW